MPYLYSDEQIQIREEVRRAMAGTADPATLRVLLETPGHYDERFWQTAREMGWTAMAIAENDGGLGLGTLETMIVAEEAGRVVAGAPFLATGFAVAHVLKLGGRSELLQSVASGEAIVALALGEGSESLPTTSAVTISRTRNVPDVMCTRCARGSPGRILESLSTVAALPSPKMRPESDTWPPASR